MEGGRGMAGGAGAEGEWEGMRLFAHILECCLSRQCVLSRTRICSLSHEFVFSSYYQRGRIKENIFFNFFFFLPITIGWGRIKEASSCKDNLLK